MQTSFELDNDKIKDAFFNQEPLPTPKGPLLIEKLKPKWTPHPVENKTDERPPLLPFEEKWENTFKFTARLDDCTVKGTIVFGEEDQKAQVSFKVVGAPVRANYMAQKENANGVHK